MNKWSYSKLSAFDKCPCNGNLIYNEKIGLRIDSDATLFGKSVHSLVGNHFDKKQKIEYCKDMFSAEEMANKTIKRIKEKYPNHTVEHIEYRFNIPIDNDNCIVGFIDIVLKNGNDRIIIDLKTGNWLPEYEDLKKDLQLKIYNSAIPSNQQELWYLRYNLEYEFNLNPFDDIIGIVKNKIKDINSMKKFDKNITPLCSCCQFNSICFKKMEDKIRLDKICTILNKNTEERFAEEFKEIKALKTIINKKIDTYKQVLKEYMKNNTSNLFKKKEFDSINFDVQEVYDSDKITSENFVKVISIKPKILLKTIGKDEYDRLKKIFKIQYWDVK